MTNVIDYTKKRKSDKIQVCPKCGRKGLKGGVVNSKRPGAKKYDDYKHRSHLVRVAGITFEHVDEYCLVEVE